MLSRPPILAEPPPPPPHVCPDSPAAALPDPLPALPTSVAGNASLGLEGVEFLGALTCDTCLEIDTTGLPVSTECYELLCWCKLPPPSLYYDYMKV